MDNSAVLAAALNAFRRITAEAQLVFLALPPTQNSVSAECVGYAFVAIDTDLHIAMRPVNSTWNRPRNAGEISFAAGAANTDQVSGLADWEASLLSAQDVAWAGQAWGLIEKKYPWFKVRHLDGDPVVVRLKPKSFSLLRYDEQSDRLWRTVISHSAGSWKVVENGAKGSIAVFD